MITLEIAHATAPTEVAALLGWAQGDVLSKALGHPGLEDSLGKSYLGLIEA